MGIHQRKVQLNHYVRMGNWQWRLLMTPTDLLYFSSNLIYMAIKSKIFIKCNDKDLTDKTFVRIGSRVVM